MSLGLGKAPQRGSGPSAKINCPACKNGTLEWDEEIEGAICPNCSEQFHSKNIVNKLKPR